jgi:hypothetical protein
MNIELLVGVVSSAIAILLLFVGLPRKGVMRPVRGRLGWLEHVLAS